MARRRRLKPVRKRQRLLFRVIFLIILGAVSFFYFVQSSFWAVNTLTVKGNEFVTDREVIQLAGIPPEQNIFKVDLKQGEDNISLHPLVKTVQLTRKYPREIVITIEERTPVALIPVAEGFCQIDEQQYILRHVPTVSQVDLPLITGLELEDTEPGQQISSEQLKEAIELVAQFPPDLAEQIEEIDLSRQGTIYLHTVQGIQVNFGNAERVEEKAALMAEILSEATIVDAVMEYIDVSYKGAPVIKFAH